MPSRRTPIPQAARVRNVSSTSDPSARIEEITYTGLPDGMCLASPAHELPDTMARYIRDAFVHNPGLITRRGPVGGIPGIGALPYPASGMASVVDPSGTIRVAALHGDSSHGYLGVYSTDFSARTDLPLGVNLGTSPYRLVQVGARLNGGVYLAITDKFQQGANQNLILWRGAINSSYTTGTATATRGSKAITGAGTSWRASASSGMFLFVGGQYVGTVKSVEADGALTLEDAALVTGSGAYTLQPFRGVNPRVGKGYITTNATSPTVNGANTKFQADGLGTGTWDVYRSADMTFLGTVASIVSDIQLTFAANAPLNLDQEPYTAIRRDGSYALPPNGIGAVTSIWAGRQAYANNASEMSTTSQIWFSSVDDAEAIDEATQDGDYLTVPSIGPAGVATPIVAMAPTPESLLILKENEAYGLFGTTTQQFQIAPVSTDGCLSPMSVQAWNGLVLYAGRQGIQMYDGQEAIDITSDRLGWFYQESVKKFDPSKYRMWSLIDNDHYLLFIEQVEPPVPILKGSVSYPQTAFTIAIHLPTRAVTILENIHIRGSIQLPSQLGRGGTWYVVNNGSAQGVVCSADALFNSDGNDSFGCDGGTAGPDFYLETKKYSISDALLKKLWKMLLLTYRVAGGSIHLDTVPGLNEIGATAKTSFPPTGKTWDTVASEGLTWAGDASEYPTWDAPVNSQFVTKRIKFLKRAQMMSFRFWQDPGVSALTLGPWAVVVKPQRVGRV